MAGQSFRFLHASDFHLEQPLFGLAEAPDHLRDLLIDAPFIAAQRVFEAALVEEVDFLVLSGDLVHPDRGGARAIAFLLEQFELLQEHGIAAYWAGGRADPPSRWPENAALPRGVHVFAPGQVEDVSHFRDDQPLAAVLGLSWNGARRIRSADFRQGASGLFAVAAAYGRGDANALAKRRHVNYWALGGEHRRKTLFATPRVAHYPGSPQGRCPSEKGPHGCTLVQVDEKGAVRLQMIATDALRWHSERVALAENATRDDLERLLRNRMQNLAAQASERAMLVCWTISAGGRLGALLRHGGLSDELVAGLRSEFGNGPSAVWTVSLEAELPTAYPAEWYEEDTILGDFLRAVRDRLADDGLPLELQSQLVHGSLPAELASAVALPDSGARQRVLREAAMLGVDLLRGDDAAFAQGRAAVSQYGRKEAPA